MPNYRKPRQRKIIEGTFRKDRNPVNEPEPEKIQEAPKPPAHLGKYGKKKWKDLAGRLSEEGLLTVLDVEALEMLCEMYDQYRAAKDAVYQPLWSDGKRRKRSLEEYLATHSFQTQTEYSAMNRHYAEYIKLLKEFGMSPAARNRVSVKEKKGQEVDPMEEMWNEAHSHS